MTNRTNRIIGKNTSAVSRKKTTIRGSAPKQAKIPMAREGELPAGKYDSRIEKVTLTKTVEGREAVEIIYKLTDPMGNEHKMREVIPLDSWFYEKLCDALLAAGLSEEDDITDAVGVEEKVVLEYPKAGGLGHFSSRTPVTAPAGSNHDDDTNVEEEYEYEEDFLEDDD